MNQTTAMLFAAACGVAIIAWFLAIVESVGMWRFWPRVFGAGVRVWRETRALAPPRSAVGAGVETRRGQFKLVTPQLCLFRSRMRWFSLDVHTPFPIKGSVRWDGGQATVEGRIPVFTTLFMAAWLVGWTLAAAMIIVESRGALGAVGFLVLGWLFGGGMCAISVPLEIRRAKRMLSEYEAYAAGPEHLQQLPAESSGR